MSEIKPTNFIQNHHISAQNIVEKANKGIEDATSWGVLGLRVPKGPFKNEEAIKRLEKAQQNAMKLQELLDELFRTAFAPTGQK